MAESIDKYGLDIHCSMILEEYREMKPVFERMLEIVKSRLEKCVSDNNLYVTAVEARIKTEASLAGKLELKGAKYGSLRDITDILGARIITFYTDDVDKIAALVDRVFEVDWTTSVDKRKMHDLDSFGYNSLHYICRIPKTLHFDPAMPQINELRFELQMRTALQHVWATMDHDTGYKSGVEVPREYLRNLNRLAGMLELADEQFSQIRTSINNYRFKVQQLVSSGKFSEVALNGDTFRSYLQLKPFEALYKRIAAINQAEIHQASSMQYLHAMRDLGFETLGDVDDLIKNYSDDAYELAAFQIAGTDLDIISSTIAIQNLLMVYILENGGGGMGLERFFASVNGDTPYNAVRARKLVETASTLHFMNK